MLDRTPWANTTQTAAYRNAQAARREIAGRITKPATVEGIMLVRTSTGNEYRVHGYRADGSHWQAATLNDWYATT